MLNSTRMSILSDRIVRISLGWLHRVVPLLFLASCVHPLTMHSKSGERLDGRWRFTRGDSGLMQVFSIDGEILIGPFNPVNRRDFFTYYQKTFGAGSIDADGPELSVYGNGFWPLLGSVNALGDAASGENYNGAAGTSRHMVSGPLFYWTANLQGDKRTVMQCFLIGSSYTGHGLGRCKGAEAKEYTVEF